MSAQPKRVEHSFSAAPEDTALRCLTPEDRERLAMDAWEPSLLRKLLQAQNKLAQRSGRSDDSTRS